MDECPTTRDPIARLLRSDGYAIIDPPLPRPHDSLPVLADPDDPGVDLLLTNVPLEAALDGLSLVRRAIARRPDLPVVAYTTSGSVREEAEAFRLGVSDYVVLNGHPSTNVLVVRNAVRTALDGLWIGPAAATWRTAPDRVIAASPQMCALVREVNRLAAADCRVLVTGETGTGKELVARALHAGSPRELRPFVPVNCGAVPTELAEALFFGSIKGAYTGSQGDRRGYLEEAAGGTLFLDELGELPPVLQPLLLRFLESGEYQRVGEPSHRYADVRVIAATNRDVLSPLTADRFRPDLFHRFAHPLRVPPLRERLADLDAYVEHWCGTEFAGGREGDGRGAGAAARASLARQREGVEVRAGARERACVPADDRPGPDRLRASRDRSARASRFPSHCVRVPFVPRST